MYCRDHQPLIARRSASIPTALHKARSAASAASPKGDMGGISPEHIFGVEWGPAATSSPRSSSGSGSRSSSRPRHVHHGRDRHGHRHHRRLLRRAIDSLIGRLMDLILAFPFLLIILALSACSPSASRTRRAGGQRIKDPLPDPRDELLRLAVPRPHRARPGAEPARARVRRGRGRHGRRRPRILFGEILPNLWAPILVYATLTLPAYIGLEAALSFLGVGMLPPDVTFGAMLANSVHYFERVPTTCSSPGPSSWSWSSRSTSSATRSGTRSTRRSSAEAHPRHDGPARQEAADSHHRRRSV